MNGKEQLIENAKRALEALREQIGEYAWQQSEVEVNKHFNGKTYVGYSIRDWGSWINPYGSDGEQDYDWKVLDKGSKTRLKEIVEKYNKRYGVNICYMCEEKNWISFEIEIE